MKCAGRVQSARATSWVANYKGKNIVRGYRNWFGVDLICAIAELRMLGVKISADYEAKVRQSIEDRARATERRKRTREQEEPERLYPDSDDTYAFIAGYTAAGFPYGVTWDELGEEPPWIEE